MKAVVSLTESSDRNFHHAILCAKRSAEDPDLEAVEIVARGSGVELFADDCDRREDVQELIEKGIVCKVSEPCVEAREMTLLEGVQRVPSGAIEMVRLQSEGYSPIKVP